MKNDRLARALAGLRPQAPPTPTTLDFLPPYTGLRNEPANAGPLPPFQMPMGQNMPSHGLPAFNAASMGPPPAQQQPMPQPMPPPQAMPPMMGGQGFAGPEPAPGTMPAPYDPNLDPRYLPEQWRGAFNFPTG